jgi:hypothetical protein
MATASQIGKKQPTIHRRLVVLFHLAALKSFLKISFPDLVDITCYLQVSVSTPCQLLRPIGQGIVEL